MGAVRLPNAQVHRGSQLSPALPLPRDRGHVALHRPAAIIALATARRDVRQDALMTGKFKGKGDFFFFFFEEAGTCNCILNTISFSFLLTQLIASLQSDVKN